MCHRSWVKLRCERGDRSRVDGGAIAEMLRLFYPAHASDLEIAPMALRFTPTDALCG
jgi:hypothetical protein